MTTHRNAALDPRHFVIIKPLPILKPSGEKLQARSRTVWSACQPTREQVFWDNYHRRQWQLSRQGYRAAPWRPYEEVGQPLYLETKRLILESLGQPVEEASKADPLPEEDVPVSTTPSDSPGANKSFPFRCPQAGKREDAVSLRKHLGHTSRLVSAVRQGRGYFHLLQKEEQEQEEAQQREQKRREEWQRVQPRPPCSESDSDSNPGRKKARSARPFTPIHHSLTSPQAPEPPQEPIFRQLCCLNWLLEALTLDRTGRAGPVTSCWDLKDPGHGKTTIKTLNKERAIETKWDQFVSLPKPRRTGSRPRSSSGRLYLLKGSSLSVASSSALTTPTLLGSLSSLGPGIEDTGATLTGAIVTATGTSQDSTEQPGAGGDSETELPMSEYLQKLLDEVHQSVTKDFSGPEQIHGDGTLTVGYRPPTQPTPQRVDNTTRPKTKDTPRPKSCPAKLLSATSELIRSKRSMLWDMRTAYEERAEELAQSFSDSLDHNARKRLESGIQRFQALCHVTHSHLIPRHVTPWVTGVKPPETDCSKNNNMWLSSLLSNLPPEVSQDRGVSRVLEKLSRFADERTPKVRPHVFLKMLGGLQPWELCLPDLCVAIEIAREHVVQMSREDYDSWLLSRVTLPQQQDH